MPYSSPGGTDSAACFWTCALSFGPLSHAKILCLNTVGAKGVYAIQCGVYDILALV